MSENITNENKPINPQPQNPEKDSGGIFKRGRGRPKGSGKSTTPKKANNKSDNAVAIDPAFIEEMSGNLFKSFDEILCNKMERQIARITNDEKLAKQIREETQLTDKELEVFQKSSRYIAEKYGVARFAPEFGFVCVLGAYTLRHVTTNHAISQMAKQMYAFSAEELANENGKTPEKN